MSPPPSPLIRQRPRRTIISLTPLIDVVFIMLVFFMLSSSFADQRIVGLQMAAQEGQGNGEESVLRVTLGPGSALRLNGEPLTLRELVRKADDRRKRDPRIAAIIAPGETVPLQRTVDIVAALKGAGLAAVTLAPRGGME